MALKILFLDDDPEIVDLFIVTFSSADVVVAAFTEPEQAIHETHHQAFDLIFLDFRMPQISGDEVAERMPPQVPKYLLTGEILPKVDYPFVEVLQKPFVEKRIAELIFQRSSKA